MIASMGKVMMHRASRADFAQASWTMMVRRHDHMISFGARRADFQGGP
jgi:hypothetical protein